jgi:hypothetical protein
MPRPRKPESPFRYFNSSPEVIRLVVLMYVRFPLSALSKLIHCHFPIWLGTRVDPSVIDLDGVDFLPAVGIVTCHEINAH